MSEKLNVLFITSDQQHYETIGKFNKKIKTPNIDRIIDEGVLHGTALTRLTPPARPQERHGLRANIPRSTAHGRWEPSCRSRSTRWARISRRRGTKRRL